MNAHPVLFASLLCVVPAAAQQIVAPQPLGEPATTVYRQVTTDGRIVYSDRRQPGAKVEQTLQVELPPQGGMWSVEGGKRVPEAHRVERTPVKQVASIPPPGQHKTPDEVHSEVIRAEMLLEDARRKRDAAHSPLPEELGDTGPDSAYAERQRKLAREVAQAEAALEQARTEMKKAGQQR